MNMILGLTAGSLLYFGFSEKRPVTITMGVVAFLVAMML